MLKNNANGLGVLNYNAGFFGGASAQAQKNVKLPDSFANILSEQYKWQNSNRIGSVAGGTDLVNYSELYHPFSLHNTVTGQTPAKLLPSDLDDATN